MEQMYALLTNDKFVWCAMAIIIYLITLVFSFFYKKLTNKIENEVTRKIANKVIVLVALGLGVGLQLLLCHFTKAPFVFATSLTYAMSAMAIHELVQVKSGKKDLAFDPSEVKKDLENIKCGQLITTNTQNNENQEQPQESAIDKFLRNRGNNNGNY